MRISVINFILALALTVMVSPDVGADDNVPNFNYPQTVMKNADKSLDKALKEGNHVDVVRYLIQSTIAEAQISSDNIPGILNKIDSVAALETDSAAVAITHYLKAVVYGSYFSTNAYAISQRKPMEGERSSDISEWTQADFVDAVVDCLSQSLAGSDALFATPVGKYIDTDELSAAIYPTMLDVVTYRGVNLLDQISQYRYWGARGTAFGSEASERADKLKYDAMASLIERHKDNAAPYINAIVACIEADEADDAGKALKSLYEEYCDNEFCYLALEAYLPTIDDDNKLKYSLLGDYVKRFPGSPFTPAAKNVMSHLAQKGVNLVYDSRFTTADSVAVTVVVRNVNTCRILVYRVPDGMEINSKITSKLKQLQLAAETTVKLQGEVPFADTVEVKLPPLAYGRYVVLPDYDDVLKEKPVYPQEFRVTDISLFNVRSSSGVKVFAVDAVTGKPLEGVYINKLTKNDLASTGRIAAHRTNADGYCLIKDGDNRMQERVAAVKGGDRYGAGMYVGEFHLYEAEPTNIEVFTDLGVYRPGDTLQYSAICYAIDRNGKRVIGNLPVEVKLKNANYRDIETDSLVTDEYGRISGEFVIPTDRMNGSFSLVVNGENAGGVRHFQVSEYKAPTFFVEFDGDRCGFSRDTDVTLTGRAEYFTGVPVADARVALSLGFQDWSWWYFASSDNSTHIDDYTVTTDSDGRFSIIIPRDVLNDKDLPVRAQFLLEAAVTDDAGEQQSATRLFWLGKARSIEATGGDFTFEVSGGIAELPVRVRTSDPADTSIVCNYTFRGRNTSYKGSFPADKPCLVVASLPSGEYKLNIAIEGDSTVDFDADVVLFRRTDAESPVDSPLWVPDCELAVSDDNVASLLLGNSTDTAYVYCVAASKKGIVKETWLHYGKGLHRFSIDIPQEEDEYIDLTLIANRTGKAYTWSHRFNSRMHRDTLRIMPVAFRDNLVPGAPETWTFKLVNQEGQLRRGAMLCDMYDKALDMIASHSWNFDPELHYVYGMLYGVNTYYVYPTSIYTSLNYPIEAANDVELPDFEFYGRNYAGRIYLRGGSYRMMSKAAMPEASNGVAMAVTELASHDELAMDAGPDAELSEEVVVTDGGEIQSQLDNVQLRTADIQNALWRPSLVADADGNVSITFNSPQFNTTWLFKAIAYTQDLHTATIVREVVTRKPVMVRASLPRFVRNGDRATLSSVLSNATDSVQHCTAVVELFDIETGETFMTKQFEATLDANGSQSIDIEWTVPADMSAVGYRVKAATAEFGDGEQHLLPVLPSVSPVIETEPFYLPGSSSYMYTTYYDDMVNGRMTLEFCNNPVWYCVTALPSIKQDDYLSAGGLAHSLYAIAVAQGIAASNPGIKQAVDAWLADENDSTLVSNLAKNEDLKIGTLLASPWINEADRQTLRMQSIGELFDSAAVATETGKIIEKLRSLQMSDGGWTWLRYTGCTSSQYVTMQVLQLMGELQHLGYLKDNADIAAMVKKAVAYIDRCAVEDYGRLSDKRDLAGFYGYAYVRTLFPDEKFATGVQSVFKAVLDCMKRNWEAATGLGDKAWCAMTLYRNGEQKTARDIMESVRQYGISDKNGMYWDNFKNGSDRGSGRVAVTSTLLQAFGEICPDDIKIIDSIRQWLLLQKQSTDWGNCSLAADAVYAILSTGTDWLGEQPVPSIKVNGEQLDYGPVDMLLGYFRKQVYADESGKFTLSIDRSGASSPSWGALYCQYSAEMDEIKAAKIDDLSVEKQICKLDGGKLDSKAVLAVGDKILVRLVIKNKRDLQFVTLNDERAACCEPADQLSGYKRADGVGYYLETKDSVTRLFFSYLPKGTHVITYEVSVTSPGTYNLGIATIQSQYAPQITAHSAGGTVTAE